jgi:hypothetical protein
MVLVEYLINTLRNAVQEGDDFRSTKVGLALDIPEHIEDVVAKFRFGTWRIAIRPTLGEDEESYRALGTVPGIHVGFNSILYTNGGDGHHFFPLADPKCSEKIIKLIDFTRRGESPWKFIP